MAENLESLQLTLDPTSLILSQFCDPMNSNNNLQLVTSSYFLERGVRYNDYAQLRESRIQSKRFQLYEIEPILEIPTSNYSPQLKKSVKFHGSLSDIEENKLINFHGASSKCEEYSPSLKKSVKFHGNLGQCEVNESVSAIPKPDFLRKSVKFHETSNKVEDKIKVCEVSPLRKSMKFQGIKQGSSVPKKENRTPTPENIKSNRVSRVEKIVTPPPSMVKREKMYESVSKYGKAVNSGEKQSNGRMNMIMGRKSYASIEELKGLSIVGSNGINGDNIRGGKKCNVLRKSTIFSTKYY